MVRREISEELLESAAEYPVVTVLGPRQAGKTTLVRMTFPDKPYVSLEDPDVRLAAQADPRGFLRSVGEGAILDEVQRLPSLLSYLQGMVDEHPMPGRFVLTGSHQPELHQAVAQTLAGRTAVLTLWPFSVGELRHYKPTWDAFELIVKGCFPRLHQERLSPRRFFNSYLQTYVERDVRALVRLRDLSLFQRFLVLLAGRVGQVVNHSALASDVGVSATTIRNWLNVLQASYVVFEVPPYFQNIRKRVVKSPKVYFTDVGLCAFLLGIHSEKQAFRDPLRGNLYENLVVTEVIKGALNRGVRPEVYFFRDARGNEVDLVVRHEGTLIPVEIKSSETFSPEFLKGIKRFRSLGAGPTSPGFVLYNGDRPFDVRGTSVRNPLHVEHLWQTLTAPPGEKAGAP